MFETPTLPLQLLPASVCASWNSVQIQQNNAYYIFYRAKIRANCNIEAHGYFEHVKVPIGAATYSAKISLLQYVYRAVDRQPGLPTKDS